MEPYKLFPRAPCNAQALPLSPYASAPVCPPDPNTLSDKFLNFSRVHLFVGYPNDLSGTSSTFLRTPPLRARPYAVHGTRLITLTPGFSPSLSALQAAAPSLPMPRHYNTATRVISKVLVAYSQNNSHPAIPIHTFLQSANDTLGNITQTNYIRGEWQYR